MLPKCIVGLTDYLYCTDEEPIELLAEPCAINSFDIDRENPSVSKNCINMGLKFELCGRVNKYGYFIYFPNPLVA